MFKQLFMTMNDALEEIVQSYPTATGMKQQALDEKIRVLKTMSDLCMEEWLRFDEKLSRFLEEAAGPAPDAAWVVPHESVGGEHDPLRKGQGYYELTMFDHAVREFEKAVLARPDAMLPRLYLAMGHLELGNDAEADRHFRLLLSLTKQPKVLAVVYNALGCIQAKRNNLEQAVELFRKAHRADPQLADPMLNIGTCFGKAEPPFQGGL